MTVEIQGRNPNILVVKGVHGQVLLPKNRILMSLPLKIKRGDLIHPELSYIIVGCLYEVWNELGLGHSECTYQKATAVMLRKKNLKFMEQLPAPVYFQERLLNNRFLDFLVEDKIVVDLKKNERFAIGHINQIHDYLVRTKLNLGMIANFTFEGVKTKRVININH